MIVFDFLFYKIYKFYEQVFRTAYSEVYSAGIISVLQMFNIMTVLYYIPSLNMKNLKQVEIIGIIGLFFLFLNFIRYYPDKKHEIIIKRWDEEKLSRKKRLSIVITLYSVLTIVFYVSSLVYVSK